MKQIFTKNWPHFFSCKDREGEEGSFNLLIMQTLILESHLPDLLASWSYCEKLVETRCLWEPFVKGRATRQHTESLYIPYCAPCSRAHGGHPENPQSSPSAPPQTAPQLPGPCCLLNIQVETPTSPPWGRGSNEWVPVLTSPFFLAPTPR